MAQATTKSSKKTVKPQAQKPVKKRMLTFRATAKGDVTYFTPVNKRAKRMAKLAGRRTLVTQSDLKALKAQGKYTFGIYQLVAGHENLRSLRV